MGDFNFPDVTGNITDRTQAGPGIPEAHWRELLGVVTKGSDKDRCLPGSAVCKQRGTFGPSGDGGWFWSQ